jgi:hypothetical protein
MPNNPSAETWLPRIEIEQKENKKITENINKNRTETSNVYVSLSALHVWYAAGASK